VIFGLTDFILFVIFGTSSGYVSSVEQTTTACAPDFNADITASSVEIKPSG